MLAQYYFIRWVFKTMFSKGLVYRGYKVMPYSTACGTPISNFEAGTHSVITLMHIYF
jgi:isoleucyl-tRNA synthetase